MPDLNSKISLSSQTVIFSISLLTSCSSYSVILLVCVWRKCRISFIRFLSISCSASFVTTAAFFSLNINTIVSMLIFKSIFKLLKLILFFYNSHLFFSIYFWSKFIIFAWWFPFSSNNYNLISIVIYFRSNFFIIFFIWKW